ncbi:hypothetical protein ACIRRH_17795 [Kitasatospora sp. NPDC101235]|uniref:hypothetical protein n=1 Tax=Kitasatospora sp. NPDC101235 TaxID=3364101 RepID=UPI00380CE24B
MSTLAPVPARPGITALLTAHSALRGEFARLAGVCRAPGAEALRAGTAALRAFRAFRLALPARRRRMRGVYGHLDAAGAGR